MKDAHIFQVLFRISDVISRQDRPLQSLHWITGKKLIKNAGNLIKDGATKIQIQIRDKKDNAPDASD